MDLLIETEMLIFYTYQLMVGIKKNQNIAGIAIGSDIWMANENLVFPPVVILSACHVSPGGRGAVCISDLIMRNGAIAVLGNR